MSQTKDIPVPDIGDFDSVEIIEVLVSEGDEIQAEDSLITLESDKASMEIPSPEGGTVKSVKVKVGDKVAEGDVILTLETADSGSASDEKQDGGEDKAEKKQDEPAKQEQSTKKEAAGKGGDDRKERPQRKPAPDDTDIQCQVLVLGSGPGGYTAAFRAADLGLEVVLVERFDSLGGVCLNVGCIPSKAYLHTAEVITGAEDMAEHGVTFGKPKIDNKKLAAWKDKVVGKLTGGLKSMAKQRGVTVVHGNGQFTSPQTVAVETKDGTKTVGFEQAIIAAGSESIKIPNLPWDDERVMTSTLALDLAEIPKRLLVVGGGIIGMEMACVYDALGSKVTVVEMADGLMPGTDRDLVKVLEKRVKGRYENIFLKSKVTRAEAQKGGIKVHFEGDKTPDTDTFDRVLVSVGRVPNGHNIGADAAGVEVGERGFIAVDEYQRTNVEHIFAIGDIVGQPMLAHKATHEGKVAAEVCAGEKSAFDARTIPSVAYTDPEIAWMGLTETAAKEQGVKYEKASFPWQASGRALGMGREDGVTKVLYDPETHRILGAGIAGAHAGDLIAEATLALEMGADIQDVGLTIHPHPTLSETFAFANEIAEGTITDLYIPKKKKK
ncbi:MAG: dihydrolipoyl dehydrogenase [Halofilum sp. (in: g-proteobacteria)]|nr:dihydrolipoyl dehydrogenase [Halofilum sp. (in: g-proteobacteria)]